MQVLISGGSSLPETTKRRASSHCHAVLFVGPIMTDCVLLQTDVGWSVSQTPPKWQENDFVSGGHGPAWPSWELAWTMNWVDRLRTSADKRMWSGRRAVVMRTGRRAELLGVKLGFPRSRCHAVVSDVLCVHSYVHFVCVCVYMCMCVCVRT